MDTAHQFEKAGERDNESRPSILQKLLQRIKSNIGFGPTKVTKFIMVNVFKCSLSSKCAKCAEGKYKDGIRAF